MTPPPAPTANVLRTKDLVNQFTDLVIVSFLENQPEGDTFVRSRHGGWPLHITLVPWFGVSDYEKLDLELRRIVQKQHPVTAVIGSEQLFGSNHDIPVNVIENQTELKQLHDELTSIIQSGGEFFEAQWVGDKYNAHITKHMNEGQQLNVGDRCLIDHLYVVKMLDDDHCQFLKKYHFGAGDETTA